MPRSGLPILLCLALVTLGCGKGDPPVADTVSDEAEVVPTEEKAPEPSSGTNGLTRSVPREAQPDRIDLRLIVVGCNGFGLSDLVDRSLEEARARARSAAKALSAGGDLDEIVARFSDDPDRARHHGVILLRNYGVAERSDRPGELTPDRLPGVARLAFTLRPGDVAIVEPEAKDAPLGFYVLLRER